jgi:hypothetical protein
MSFSIRHNGKDKPITLLTVGDVLSITETSNYERSTFYLHYATPQEKVNRSSGLLARVLIGDQKNAGVLDRQDLLLVSHNSAYFAPKCPMEAHQDGGKTMTSIYLQEIDNRKIGKPFATFVHNKVDKKAYDFTDSKYVITKLPECEVLSVIGLLTASSAIVEKVTIGDFLFVATANSVYILKSQQ